MKKSASLFFSLLMLVLFAMPFSVQASEESSQMVFVSDILLSSAESQANISILSEDLNQIVLCTKKEGEVWTIGILKDGNTVLTYDEIRERLDEEIPLLDTSADLSPDDFYVEYYETDAPKSEIMSLNSVEDSFVSNQPTKMDALLDSSSNAATDSILSSWTIDGSYYQYTFFGGKHIRVWYNQITDTKTEVHSSISEPYMGDGNNRTDSGFYWFPEYVRAEFFTVPQWYRTDVSLTFSFSPANLRNLNYDDNEALEMEIVFYNYTNVKEEEKGYSFIPVSGNPSTHTNGNDYRNPRSWWANFENAYLDTAFADSRDKISSCVGIYDTSTLVANKNYLWDIHYYGFATRQNKPNDGRFNVIAQRSYRIDDDVNNPELIPFKVFTEEHEGMIKYGLEPKIDDEDLKLWIDASQNAFDNESWECDLRNGDPWRNY